jgi:signal transduction histidine kinase
MNRMSIKSKITVLFALVALIPYAVIAIFIYTDVRSAMEKAVVDKVDVLANIQKSRTEEVISKYETQFAQFASQLLLRKELEKYNLTHDLSDLTSIQESLDGAKNGASDIEDISILTPSGEVIVSTDKSIIGKNLSQEPFFQKQDQGDTSPTLIKKDHTVYLYLSRALTLNGKTIGVFALLLKTDDLFALFKDYSGIGKTGAWGLAEKLPNGDALIIVPGRYDTDPNSPLEKIVKNSSENAGIPIMRALRGEEQVYPDLINYVGKHVIAATRYIPELKWGIGVTEERSEALASAANLANQLVFFSALLALFVSFLSLIISRIIVKPIIQLSHVADRLSQSDFTTAITYTHESNDELGMLSQAFKRMAERLKESYETLENKVHERTVALVEAKAKDDAILASIKEGIVVTDAQGHPIYSNDSAKHILGLLPTADQDAEKNLHYGIFEKDQTTLVPVEKLPIERAIRGEIVEGDIFFLRNAANPHGVFVRGNAAPIRSAGNISGAVCTFIDVTIDQEIDKAKTEFVSIASHQLRTPATSIRWYTEMLLGKDVGPLNKTQRKYLNEIYRSDRNMIELVNALLNVSRIELGTFALQTRFANLEKLIEDILRESAPQISDKKIKLKKEYSAKEEIETDPQMLRVVLQNLMANAIEYTPIKGTISCKVTVSKGGAEIIISDSGCGIPPHAQKKIFTKFFRADNARVVKPDGNGLGLYITKSIVEALHGTISFISHEGSGTTFTVILPLHIQAKKKGLTLLQEESIANPLHKPPALS